MIEIVTSSLIPAESFVPAGAAPDSPFGRLRHVFPAEKCFPRF